MPEDLRTEEELAEEVRPPAHDDIMKRLLEYQRQLREGLAAEQEAPAPISSDYVALEGRTAIATERGTLVDIGAVEVQAAAAVAEEVWSDVVVVPEAGEESAAASTSALQARVAELEDTIAKLSRFLAELRRQSQDAAIAVDDAFAAIDQLLGKTKQK